MFGNKKRLYVALYANEVSNDDLCRYSWSLLVGPKNESRGSCMGWRYQIRRSKHGAWRYEASQCDVRNTPDLLVRVLVAKVTDPDHLAQICLVVRARDSYPTCRDWVQDVLAALERDGRTVGKAMLNRDKIYHDAKDYAMNKKNSGRFLDDASPKPTFDMLQDLETVS